MSKKKNKRNQQAGINKFIITCMVDDNHKDAEFLFLCVLEQFLTEGGIDFASSDKATLDLIVDRKEMGNAMHVLAKVSTDLKQLAFIDYGSERTLLYKLIPNEKIISEALNRLGIEISLEE